MTFKHYLCLLMLFVSSCKTSQKNSSLSNDEATEDFVRCEQELTTRIQAHPVLDLFEAQALNDVAKSEPAKMLLNRGAPSKRLLSITREGDNLTEKVAEYQYLANGTLVNVVRLTLEPVFEGDDPVRMLNLSQDIYAFENNWITMLTKVAYSIDTSTCTPKLTKQDDITFKKIDDKTALVTVQNTNKILHTQKTFNFKAPIEGVLLEVENGYLVKFSQTDVPFLLYEEDMPYLMAEVGDVVHREIYDEATKNYVKGIGAKVVFSNEGANIMSVDWMMSPSEGVTLRYSNASAQTSVDADQFQTAKFSTMEAPFLRTRNDPGVSLFHKDVEFEFTSPLAKKDILTNYFYVAPLSKSKEANAFRLHPKHIDYTTNLNVDLAALRRISKTELSALPQMVKDSLETPLLISFANASQQGLNPKTLYDVVAAVGNHIRRELHYNNDMLTFNVNEQLTIGEILERKSGVCHHFSKVFMAVLARLGILSREIGGYNITMSDPSRGGGHSWIEVWNGKTWIPLEPQQALSFDLMLDYIPMLIVTKQSDVLALAEVSDNSHLDIKVAKTIFGCKQSGQMGTVFYSDAREPLLDCTGVTYQSCDSGIVCCSQSNSALDTRFDPNACKAVVIR